MPKVSVVLPTYNGSRFLKRAIQSVLTQTFLDFELVIVDDGSSDKTPEIAKEYSVLDPRVKAVRNEQNLGIQKSLNKGLREARGEYIARIDDDDEWTDSSKLSRQAKYLDAHSDCVLVGTGTIVVDESGRELFRFLNPETDIRIRRRLLGKNCFTHSSVMFRKSVAMQFNGYDENKSARHVEDYDLWLKLGTKGKLANLPIHAVRFALRPGNISSKNKIEQFRKGLALARKYRRHYPNFLGAFTMGYARLILYGVFNFIPFAAAKARILKFYKEH